MKSDSVLDGRRTAPSESAIGVAATRQPYELTSLQARSVRIEGFGGDEIEAYLAGPAAHGPRPGVVVVHPMSGYSDSTIDSVLRLARLGYDAICPNLFWRDAPGAPPCAASSMARMNGGVPDERAIGDLEGARSYLRALSASSEKAGIIGFGAGAREAVLAACSVDFDAVVDCYGEFILGPAPDGVFAFQTSSIRAQLPNLRAPLLGLFGREDSSPDPAQVIALAGILLDIDNAFELHSYEHAGHGFMSLDHASYSVAVAKDAWDRIAAFLKLHLGG
jgi:carboxymethylenebutenolidase